MWGAARVCYPHVAACRAASAFAAVMLGAASAAPSESSDWRVPKAVSGYPSLPSICRCMPGGQGPWLAMAASAARPRVQGAHLASPSERVR